MTRFLLISAIAFELVVGRAAAGNPAAAVNPATPIPFQALLAQSEHRVEQFWDQFSAVTCIESVEQTKLGDDEKILFKKDSTYDYLVLLQLSGGDLLVQESRLLKGKPGKQSDRPLLSTGGFSAMVLVFHPHFRESFRFSDAGVDPNEPALRRIHFEHIHGQSSPAVLQLRSREYPIEWQGTAWIDVATGNVARIQANIGTTLEDVGLKRLETEVSYAPMALQGQVAPAWMPTIAQIQADTVHQHWRNTHKFSAYKQFSVSTDSTTQAPSQESKQ